MVQRQVSTSNDNFFLFSEIITYFTLSLGSDLLFNLKCEM